VWNVQEDGDDIFVVWCDGPCELYRLSRRLQSRDMQKDEFEIIYEGPDPWCRVCVTSLILLGNDELARACHFFYFSFHCIA
jgi:hypothetical protein